MFINVAKPDGLTVGSMGAALVANAVLGEPGVQYDIDKFIYLGTPDSAQHYLFITHRRCRPAKPRKTARCVRGAHRRAIGRVIRFTSPAGCSPICSV